MLVDYSSSSDQDGTMEDYISDLYLIIIMDTTWTLGKFAFYIYDYQKWVTALLELYKHSLGMVQQKPYKLILTLST